MIGCKSITQTENNQQDIQNKKAKQRSLLHSLHDGVRTLTAARTRGLTQIN